MFSHRIAINRKQTKDDSMFHNKKKLSLNGRLFSQFFHFIENKCSFNPHLNDNFIDSVQCVEQWLLNSSFMLMAIDSMINCYIEWYKKMTTFIITPFGKDL